VNILSFVLPEFFLSPALVAFFTSTNTKVHDDKLDRARRMISLFILRRSKQMVLKDMPSKRNEIVWCDMTTTQSQRYKEVQKDAIESNCDFMTLLTNMRKCANHPLLLQQYVYRRLNDGSYFPDETLPKIARQLKKESYYKETPLDYVIEDLELSSDFVLHSKCQEYSVNTLIQYADS